MSRIVEIGAFLPITIEKNLGWEMVLNTDVLTQILKHLDLRGNPEAREMILNDVEKRWSESILRV